jgi:hypothetical protein
VDQRTWVTGDSKARPERLPDGGHRDGVGHRPMVLALLVAVVVLDQASKWGATTHGGVIRPIPYADVSAFR